MMRYVPKPNPGLYFAIALTLAAVLITDLLTPLGIAVWLFYFIPVILTLYTWRPTIPVIIASITTVLIIATFLTDAPGTNRDIARINRGFAIATVWIVAYTSYQFIQNKIAVKRLEWLQNGQMGLAETVRGEPRLEEVGADALRFLAEYLDAHAGAIFVRTEDGFRRFATYAAKEADLPERVHSGEGLLGQAIADGRAFIVRDVPDGYLPVASSLGKVKSRSLLIAPTSVDGQVNGVLELAFIHPVTDDDPDLLAQIAETLGVALRSAKYRARLYELNAETQRQNEELQAQSEELRVSNEELEEQGRALRESQARLELQQTELEQTNSQLEEQAQLLEIQKDELLKTAADLDARGRDLEQANRYKSDFLANMSHELRTPLNSSLILAKLLADNREGNLTGEQVKYAQTIQSAGNDLLALISDILDLSKIEAGHLEVRPQPMRIAHLIDNLTRTFQPVANQKSLTFRTEVAPGAPESIETDPQRIEQILKNLLSNAHKFTERGEVVLEVSPAGKGRVAFTVRDTGIGIPAHQQAMVFEAFRQADGTTNRKYGGTGLGLSISRELSRLLGGQLGLTSEMGHGSVFTLTVPEVFDSAIVPPPAPRPVEPPRGLEEIPSPSFDEAKATTEVPSRRHGIEDDRDRLQGGGRVILIVEDDEPFARILYTLAHEHGFQCLVATSAEEGLSLANRFLPSAVVLDVGLPDHSGLSVLDRLKQDGRTRHIPVHVVSGHDYAHTAMSLGAVGYMLKPVKHDELAEAFQQLGDRLNQSLRRILIVEDDAVQLDSLRLLLGSDEVETVGARSAAECLDLLRTNTFDCMVLDLTLPDSSGFALLETLGREEQYAFPPVIVYTGRELDAGEEQQLRRYSKSIIVKGAKSPERLLDEVTLFLHQVVAELPPDKQKLLEKARFRDAALEDRRILVVEDDVRNIFALTSILEPRGAKVQIARNGREALEVLTEAFGGAGEPIDLVLMDIMMPEMDGLTAMREIRKRAEWRKLPIIALTAKAMKDDQEQALEAGANDYMAKPLDVERLLSLVRVWISR
ncbi:MAG: response regulator [Fimbriimonas sp.]